MQDLGSCAFSVRVQVPYPAPRRRELRIVRDGLFFYHSNVISHSSLRIAAPLGGKMLLQRAKRHAPAGAVQGSNHAQRGSWRVAVVVPSGAPRKKQPLSTDKGCFL